MFGKDKKEDGKDGEVTNADVVGALKELGESFANGFKAMTDGVQGLRSDIATQAEKSVVPLKDDVDDDPIIPKDKKVEDLTTEEILSAVEKTVERTVAKGLKGTTERIDSNELADHQRRLKTGLLELQKSDPLFDVLRDKMTEIVKADPSLASNPRRLLAIAKDENKEVVQEFEKTQEDAKNEAKKDEKPKFGGLMPGSSGGGSTDEEAGKMDSKEAAEKAWDETMSEVPSGMIGGAAA